MAINATDMMGALMRATRVLLVTAALAAACLACPPEVAAQDDAQDDPQDDARDAVAAMQVDSVMYQDPRLVMPKGSLAVPSKLKRLWVAALERPDPQLQRLAADTLALAGERGMQGLADTQDLLAQLVAQPEQDAALRRAAARALIVLDARHKAELLAEQAARGGLDMVSLIEPALARWDYQPMRQRWLERLGDPDVPRTLVLLAIECLSAVGETQATEALREMVRDRFVPVNVRLAAARALAALHKTGLSEEADRLADAEPPAGMVERILGGTLLAAHTDELAIAVLHRLARDPEPAVAGLALARLLAIDPALVDQHATAAIARHDANIRRVAAECLVVQGNLPAVELLGPRLDDTNPSLRRYVAASLIQLAEDPELHDEIIAQATRLLAGQSWRGIEQATVVLAHLDHKAAAPRLAELLEHPRAEAYVAAAWGLRKLRVPETLPAMLDKATRQDARFRDQTVSDDFIGAGQQLSQLFQAFGEMRYREAEPLLRKCVPKNLDLDVTARAAAVWALGYFYEQQAPEDLTKQLIGRLEDVSSLPPEFNEVRRMAAVSLGRMGSQAAQPSLRQFAEEEQFTTAGRASAWAFEQLTGERIEQMMFYKIDLFNWFLVPLD